ncbi:MAG: membrane-bound lytic murein transglycosylase A [Alphaproteobacteria bacterium]
MRPKRLNNAAGLVTAPSRSFCFFISAQARGFAALMICAGFVWSCAPRLDEDRVHLSPTTFDALPGWFDDDPRGALVALSRSCTRHIARPPPRLIGPRGIAGRAADWAGACTALAKLNPDQLTPAHARAFIERHFQPFAVTGAMGEEGLFTGYYEAAARGARQRSARYNVPIYRRPDDLVSVDLSIFSEEFRGRTIAGRVRGGRLEPYADRRRIARGGLKNRALEILWLDDPVDAFFMEIQGSGRVNMDDGSVVRVGFAAKNGHPYTAIGRVLVEMGAMDLNHVSMQSIRAWLAAHPAKARAVMEQNKSYVFFRELTGDGPIGAEGVALTPGRSLAIDRKFLPLGVPFFLSADDSAGGLAPVRSLVVAQDTGGAIRGPVRGDLFLGWGESAAARAGRMKMRGRYWILLPRGKSSTGPQT